MDNLLQDSVKFFAWSALLAFLLSVRHFRLVFFRNNHLKAKYLKKLDLYSSSTSMGFVLPN